MNRKEPAPSSAFMTGGTRAFSDGEMRLKEWRRRVGLFVGPLVFVVVWLAPLDLPTSAHRLAAIVALVVIWWMSESVPLAVASLVGPGLVVLTGVAPARTAFAPFATPIIFLFIGAFMMSRAVSLHGLDLRVASAILRSRVVGGRLVRVPLALGLFTLAVTAWVSGAATTAMMVPLAGGVVAAMRAQGHELGSSYLARLMLMIGFASTVGSRATPVGAPSNLVALGFLESTGGPRIDFVTWFIIGIPMVLTMAVALVVVMHWMMPHSQTDIDARLSASAWEKLSEGPMTAGQRNCALVFGVAATLWILPGAIQLISPGSPMTELLNERLDMGSVAILAASALFVMPANTPERRFTLDWKEAVQIDWGTILLFGGGLSLGTLMFSTGLAEILGRGIILLSGATSLWSVTALSIAAAILLTQFTSNMATAAMLTPVVLSIVAAAGINPVPPVLGVAFGCGIAYLLPISTATNAIVYGTGVIPLTAMIKMGAVMCVVGFVATFLSLYFMLPLLGLA